MALFCFDIKLSLWFYSTVALAMLSLLILLDSNDSVIPASFSGLAPDSNLPIYFEVAAVCTSVPDRAYETKLTLPSSELLRFHSSSSLSSSMD